MSKEKMEQRTETVRIHPDDFGLSFELSFRNEIVFAQSSNFNPIPIEIGGSMELLLEQTEFWRKESKRNNEVPYHSTNRTGQPTL